MTDILQQNNENTDDVVRQKSYKDQIVKLIDSTENLREDFYNIFDRLPKDDKLGFITELIQWTSTNKPTRYLNRKYIQSRNSENPIFNFHSLELSRAELEDNLYLKGVRSYEDLKYPATEFWIDRKSWEIDQLSEEVMSLYNSSTQTQNELLNTDDDIIDDTVYQFPNEHIDKEFNHVAIDSFRIDGNISLENLKGNLGSALTNLQDVLDEASFLAFLYNSFQFNENPTECVYLRLKPPGDITTKRFYTLIYQLYTRYDKEFGVRKPKFAKIMFMNFHHHRFDCENSDFDLSKHLKNIEKKIKYLD